MAHPEDGNNAGVPAVDLGQTSVLESSVKAGQLAASRPSDIRPRITRSQKFRNNLLQALQSLSAGQAGAAHGAALGDPLAAFVGGAAGAGTGFLRAEIAAEDRQRQIRQEQKEDDFLNAPAQLSEDMVEAMKTAGVDTTNLTNGEVLKFGKMIELNLNVHKLSQDIKENQPMDESNAKVLSIMFGKPASAFLGQPSHIIELGLKGLRAQKKPAKIKRPGKVLTDEEIRELGGKPGTGEAGESSSAVDAFLRKKGHK